MVKVAVLGCGLIGIKIAEDLAHYGHYVALYDINDVKLNEAKKLIDDDRVTFLNEGFPSHYLNNGSIIYLNSLEKAVKNAEFIFEYITENLTAKQNLFKSITDYCPITSIICSGTLSLDVNALFEDVLVPEVGLVFENV